MAETAASVIQDILQELVVQGSEAPIEADESQTAMRYMNRYMFMLDADGIKLGYTEVSNLGDTITIPNGAIMGMIKNVAAFISSQFDVPISMQLASDAREGLRVMTKLGTSIIASNMPCTLPIGSGNEVDGLNNDFHFYTCPENTITTEQGNNILLEDAT
jgi:hypothetical protein